MVFALFFVVIHSIYLDYNLFSFIPAGVPAGTKPEGISLYIIYIWCWSECIVFSISAITGVLVGFVLGVNSPSYFVRYHIHRYEAIALRLMRDMPHLRFCQSDDILAFK